MLNRATLLMGVVLTLSFVNQARAQQCPDLRIDADLAARVGLRLPEVKTRADLDAAAQLAARASAAFDAGARADALADLEAAWRRSLDVDLLGRLGLSLQAAGRLPEAWAALHRFRMEASADAWARLRAEVEAALGELSASLGGVRVRGDLGALAQVFVDGQLVSYLPFDGALYLRPGRASIEVRAAGRLARTFELDLSAGAVADLDAALPAIDADLAGRLGLPAPTLHTRADLDAAGALVAGLLGRFQAGARAELAADLEAAWRRSGDVDLLGALGLALRAAGRLPEAWIALHRFRMEASAQAWARLRAEVEAALGELAGQLGGVRIRGDFGPRAEVYVDGVLAARLPMDGAIHLAPGDVRLEVRADGRVATEVAAAVQLGSIADVDAQLPSIESVLTPAAIDLGAVGGVAANVGGVTGGLGFDPWLVVGVTGAVTGVVLLAGIIASVIHGDLNADPNLNLPGFDATGTDVAAAFEFVGYIAAGVGVAAITTIGILAAVIGTGASAAADLPDCDDLLGTLAPREPPVTLTLRPWLGETLGGALELRF